MKQERLDEIKKELEKVIEFREGTGTRKDLFFGEYQGISVTLYYMGDNSSMWIGKLGKEFKIDLAMSLMECSVRIEASKIWFHSQDCVIAVGE